MESESDQLSNPEYIDFDLEIGLGSRRKYPVVVRSAAGEACETMHFPFDELTLKTQLLALQNALLRSGGKRRLTLSPEEQTIRNFGRALFDALFTGEVRRRYVVSQLAATHQDKGLRLRLHIQSPELATLPWEFMYDPGQARYICLSNHTPLVRYLELPQPPQPLPVTPPLRILGMAIGPKDLTDLDIDLEKLRVERAIKDLQSNGLVELSWLQGQTWQDLQRAMRRGPWHIFHFIGHGGFDPRADEGLIALVDDVGRVSYLSATRLGLLLSDHRSLRLVVLNSCEGASGSEHDIFSSTASILVQQGISAVLAMQYEITDRAAIVLSHTFYEALADSWPVDAAVGEARKAISLEIMNTVEWGTPVLYMRSPNGMIFNVARSSTPSPTQSQSITVEKEAPLSTSVIKRQQDKSNAGTTSALVEEKNIQMDNGLRPTLLDETTSSLEAKDKTVWQWPSLDVEPLGTLQWHTDSVLSVAFSPDGQTLASSAHDETVRLWRAANGKPLRILKGHKDLVHCVIFAPDGQILASGSDDKTVRLWRMADGEVLHILKGHTNRVNSAAFSPNRQILASGSGDKTIRLWQVTDGSPPETTHLLEHTSLVHSVTFSPNGQILASGSGYMVWLWRMADGKLLHTLKGHTNRVNSGAFSPNGQILASGSDDKTVRLWRMADGALLHTLEEHTRGVSSVSFSPDGQMLASGSYDKTIGLWWVADGVFLDALQGHTNWVNSVAFSSDGRTLASGSTDKTVRLWRLS